MQFIGITVYLSGFIPLKTHDHASPPPSIQSQSELFHFPHEWPRINFFKLILLKHILILKEPNKKVILLYCKHIIQE